MHFYMRVWCPLFQRQQQQQQQQSGTSIASLSLPFLSLPGIVSERERVKVLCVFFVPFGTVEAIGVTSFCCLFSLPFTLPGLCVIDKASERAAAAAAAVLPELSGHLPFANSLSLCIVKVSEPKKLTTIRRWWR